MFVGLVIHTDSQSILRKTTAKRIAISFVDKLILKAVTKTSLQTTVHTFTKIKFKEALFCAQKFDLNKAGTRKRQPLVENDLQN